LRRFTPTRALSLEALEDETAWRGPHMAPLAPWAAIPVGRMESDNLAPVKDRACHATI